MSQCQLSNQAYTWQRPDGSYGCGKIEESDGLKITAEGTARFVKDWERVVVAIHPTREREWVPFSSLIPYGPPGGEPMPQPEGK
jgi:hypothetical protein